MNARISFRLTLGAFTAFDRISGQQVPRYGAENTDIESVKGGLSAVTKRAAVEWGIGWFLHGIEGGRAQVYEGGRFRGRTKDGTTFRWDPRSCRRLRYRAMELVHAPSCMSLTTGRMAVGR